MLHFHVSIRKISCIKSYILYIYYNIYIIYKIYYYNFLLHALSISLPATIFQNQFCNMQHATTCVLCLFVNMSLICSFV